MRSRREAGVTLAEMSVAVALLSTVLAVAYGTLWSSMRHGSSLEQRTVVQAETRLVLDRLTGELRQSHTGESSTPVVGSTSATDLTFYSPDRSTPFRLRRISYRLSGTDLQRSETVSTDNDGAPWTFGTTGPYRTVLEDVASTSMFTYFDGTAAATTTPADVRTVVVTLQAGKSLPAPGPLSYRVSIHLRGAA